MVTPAVHLGLPLGEGFRNDLREVVADLGGTVTDRPEESPLSVEVLRVHGQRLVLLGESVSDMFMVSGLFHGFRSHSCLVAEFRSHVNEFLPGVELLTDILEVVLDHVDVLVVVLVVHPGVPHDTDAELVEAVGHFLALELPVGVLLTFEESLEVDHRRLIEVEFVEVG